MRVDPETLQHVFRSMFLFSFLEGSMAISSNHTQSSYMSLNFAHDWHVLWVQAKHGLLLLSSPYLRITSNDSNEEYPPKAVSLLIHFE